MTFKEKLIEICMWIGGGLAALLLLVMCAADGYMSGLTKYKIVAPGIEDICGSIETQPCGIEATNCESGAQYKCVTNATVESVR